MNAAGFRQSILQAAVQGKLVPQNPEDEPASELMNQILHKRMALIKQGKAKKRSKKVERALGNVPFDIPNSWEWCHLCDLGDFSSGKTPDMTNSLYWDGATIPWITSKDMKQKYLTSSMMKITEHAQKEMTTYPAGTILIVTRSGILKRMLPVCILTMDSTINQDVKAFSLFDASISSYVFYMLKGYERYVLENYTKQVTTVDSLRFSEFTEEMLVPLPPSKELQRIVEKLDQLMALCDELEAEEQKLDALEAHFTEYLPKAILQAAVQGKLVPQNSHDEPASELLKRIQQEKAQLAKEGKIKKEKPLPPISEEEIPYDLPEGWVWCRTADICSYIQRGKSPTYSDTKMYPVVSQKCVQWDGIDMSKARFIAPETMSKYEENRLLQTGDLLWNSTGQGTLGRIAIYDKQLNSYQCAVADSHVTILRPMHILPQYMYYWFAGPEVQGTIDEKATGSTKQIELATLTIMSHILPLPPLAEQLRIVSKVDELRTLCDELKAAYTAAIPLDKIDNIIPFPSTKKEEETLLAARGDVGQLSNEAMQAIDDLFAEDEE